MNYPDPTLIARLQFSIEGVAWIASLVRDHQHESPDGGWSPHKQVFHVLAVETELHQPRIREMLRGNRPVFERWDREKHLEAVYTPEGDIATMVDDLVAARAEIVGIFNGLTLDQWRLRGTWPEGGGEVDIAWAAERMLWHSVDHFGGLLRTHLALDPEPASG